MLQPTDWKTIKQPADSKLCGAAVAAMAVGESIVYALNRMTPTYRKGDDEGYFRHREMLQFLGSHGIMVGMSLEIDDGHFERHMDIHVNLNMRDIFAILVVSSEGFPGFDHWVFWDSHDVRDPNPSLPETTDIEDYNVISVYPLCYLDESDEDGEHH